MPREIGHASFLRRIAIMVGAGHVPGINAVVMGAALAAGRLGWEIVGIRDGFDGLLQPRALPEWRAGDPQPRAGREPGPERRGSPRPGAPGRPVPRPPGERRRDGRRGRPVRTSSWRSCRRRTSTRSISVVGGRGLSIVHKLHRKGLNAVCVPRSIENDIAATQVSFGFNTALSFTIEMLDRVRQAAQAARKIGVVEVLGDQAGWLALQAGIAVCADAVLIPEIPCDLRAVAARLERQGDRPAAVGPGGGGRGGDVRRGPRDAEAKPSLPQGVPVAAGDGRGQRARHPAVGSGRRDRGQRAAAADRRRRPSRSSSVPGCGAAPRRPSTASWRWPTGPAAVGAIEAGSYGTMVAFVPPDMKFVPLAEAINKVRTVPTDGGFVADRPLPRHLPGEGAVSTRTIDPTGRTGIVLNIQRYCSHDGPGIRTNVFLKGCSLRCKWCGNPESIALKPELAYDPKVCVGRKECGAVPEASLPRRRLLRAGGRRRRQGQGQLAAGHGLRRSDGVALPAEGPLHVRQADERGRGARRGGEGRLLLPQHRGRPHAERRRVPAAAGLQRRAAERGPRARLQHGDRDGVQRALGATSRRCCPTSTPCSTTTR